MLIYRKIHLPICCVLSLKGLTFMEGYILSLVMGRSAFGKKNQSVFENVWSQKQGDEKNIKNEQPNFIGHSNLKKSKWTTRIYWKPNSFRPETPAAFRQRRSAFFCAQTAVARPWRNCEIRAASHDSATIPGERMVKHFSQDQLSQDQLMTIGYMISRFVSAGGLDNLVLKYHTFTISWWFQAISLFLPWWLALILI